MGLRSFFFAADVSKSGIPAPGSIFASHWSDLRCTARYHTLPCRAWHRAIASSATKIQKCDAKIGEYVISSDKNPKHFSSSFVWSNDILHNHLKESQKSEKGGGGTTRVPGKLPSQLSNNNFPRLPSTGNMFALYTSSLARSFASSINITGSSLAISQNRAKTRNPD